MHPPDISIWRKRALLLASIGGMLLCLVMAGARLRGLMLNTALLIGGTWLISLPLGTVVAVATAKTNLPGRRFLSRLFVALLFVPLYVQTAAWQAALGQGGWLVPDGQNWLQGWAGAIWVHGMAATAWVVLFVGTALRNVPREWEEESLQDASPRRVLWKVSLRRSLVSLVAAALWIAVICAGEIAVTDLFQVRTFAEEVYTSASLGTLLSSGPQTNSAGLATSDLWWGTLAAICLALNALAAIWAWLPAADFVSPTEGSPWRLRSTPFGFTLLAWGIAAVAIGIPLLGLVGKTGMKVSRDGDQVVRTWSASKTLQLTAKSPYEHRRELQWSLVIGGVAAATATALGILLAWLMRTKKIAGGPLAALLAIGFAIPGPLLGIAVIRLLNHPGDSALSGLTWLYKHTVLAPVLVQLLRALPLATLVLSSQLSTVPQDVLDSAKSEGAGWWESLLSVALPLRWRAVVAAACMAFIVAVGELSATLLVSPPGVSTISSRISRLLHYGAEDQVSALCLMLALSLAVLATIAWALFDRRTSDR